jgi:hypothetical protein
MKRTQTPMSLALCLVFPLCVSGACSGEPDQGSPQPQMSVATAAITEPSRDDGNHRKTICEAHPDLPALIEAPGGIATTYIQTAWSDVTACAIDGYFNADSSDGFAKYIKYQLIPWLLQFFGCHDAPPVVLPEEQYSPIGLVPASRPPPTISATDFYMIVTTFLRTVQLGPETGPCSFGFSQPEIAQMNVMLYALAPFAINVFGPDVGLTNSDPAGLNCFNNNGYVGPVNVVSACGAAVGAPFVCGVFNDNSPPQLPSLYCPL